MLPLHRFVARAPAKINLTLHVIGRRPDGYHELESLVAFAGTGDTLELLPGKALSLTTSGPTAERSGPVADNLVLKAVRLFQERLSNARVGGFQLVKRLPVAAGIGGGSSDAAAALRLLAKLNGLPLGHPAIQDAARRTGADVPVCLDPRGRMMRGAGETLGPPLRLPRLSAVLVNPGVPVETPAVFRALALAPDSSFPGDAHPVIGAGPDEDGFLAKLACARNDLERPAIALAPVIADALARLRAAPGCRLARMSGSGATVFGLFEDRRAAASAATRLRRAEPGWWVKATGVR